MDVRIAAKPHGTLASLSSGIAGWVTQERASLYPKLIFFMTVAGWLLRQALSVGLSNRIENVFCSDFLAFYTGGKFFLTHNMGNLYDFAAQHEFQKSISAIGDGCIMYMNPPFVAGFLALFSRGGYLPSLVLWWTFGIALLIVSILIFRSEFSSLKRYTHLNLLFLCLLFFPTLLWFLYGQNTTITLLIYTGTYVLLRRRKDLYAGLVFGLIAYKPQLGIGMAILFLFKRRSAVILGSMISSGICIVICFLMSTATSIRYLELMHKVMDVLRLQPTLATIEQFRLHSQVIAATRSQSTLMYNTWGVHSYFGFSSLLFDSINRVCANVLCISFIIFSILLILIISKNTKWEPEQKQWNMMIAATFSIGLLISPHLFSYDLMLLLLPIGIVWSYYPGHTNGKLLDGGMLLSTCFLMYVFCFVGGQLSCAQIRLTKALGLPVFAIQMSTLTILMWTLAIIRSGELLDTHALCAWPKKKAHD